MNPNWRSFLESAAGEFSADAAELISFGDPAGELQAAAGQTVLVPLTHLAQLEAHGDDAKSFLHSQFTSDVNHLPADRAPISGQGHVDLGADQALPAGDARQVEACARARGDQLRLSTFTLRPRLSGNPLVIERVGDSDEWDNQHVCEKHHDHAEHHPCEPDPTLGEPGKHHENDAFRQHRYG